MEWTAIVGHAIQYMERHITEPLSVETVARAVHVSPFYFQKGFSMLCGYTVGEYLRNRRLTLAGLELLTTEISVLELALKYGYESDTAFTRAFTRFHGATPSAVRRGEALLKQFAPLRLKLTVEGGYLMAYKIVKKDAFTVLASAKEFPYEGAAKSIPRFWQSHQESGRCAVVCGQFGINIDETMGQERFTYLIADPCPPGTEAPEGFVVKTIPAFDWAVFPCTGPLPESLQKVNESIYTQWLPGVMEYEFAAGYCVEAYNDPRDYPKGTQDEGYYCEVWIPVRKK